MEDVLIQEGGKGARVRSVGHILAKDKDSDDLIPFVPASDRLSGTKHVRGNGTYKASDDGLHSWSKVVVSIPGGVDGTTAPSVEVDGVSYPDHTVEPSEYTVPAGIGNSLSGYEEEYDRDYTIDVVSGIALDPKSGTVQRNVPTLVYKTKPEAIAVEKMPTESDFSDIVVTAYTRYGDVWSSSQYPDGHIPFSELTIGRIDGEAAYSTRADNYDASLLLVKSLELGESAHFGNNASAPHEPLSYEPIVYVGLNDYWRDLWMRSTSEYNDAYRSMYQDSGNWPSGVTGIERTSQWNIYTIALLRLNDPAPGSSGATNNFSVANRNNLTNPNDTKYQDIYLCIATDAPCDELPPETEICIERYQASIYTGNSSFTRPITAGELLNNTVKVYSRETLNGIKFFSIVDGLASIYGQTVTPSDVSVDGEYFTCAGYSFYNFIPNFDEIATKHTIGPIGIAYYAAVNLWNYLNGNAVMVVPSTITWTSPYEDVLTCECSITVPVD